MRRGVDLSKYQGSSAMDGFDFVILNVEDPFFGSKVAYAVARGIKWDIYKWCYDGTSGAAMFAIAQRNVDAAFTGGRYPRFWLDYEEAGVAPWQIAEWYHACDQAGVKTGLYIYLYLMNAQGVTFDRDGWLAYYPGNNDGSYYDAMSDEARRRGAEDHQFSSTNGTLDLNVVLDDAWYDADGGPAPAPGLPDLSFLEGDDMDILVGVNKFGDVQSWLVVGNAMAHLFGGPTNQFGIAAEALAFNTANPHVKITGVPAGVLDDLYTMTQNALHPPTSGSGEPPAPVDPVAVLQATQDDQLVGEVARRLAVH